jgi:hypothetical protein
MPVPFHIELFCGYSQPAYRTDGAGLWALSDEIRNTWPDCGAQVSCWNADTAPIVARIREAVYQGKEPVLAGYSYGAGHELPDVATALGSMGIDVDLALLIDPVCCQWPYTLRAMFAKLTDPFVVPSNVRKYAYWLQTNRRLIDPKPRIPTSPTAQCLLSRQFNNPDIGHGDIDNYEPVHLGVLQVLQQEYGE